MSIFIVIFYNFFWRCRNILALQECIFVFHQIFRKKWSYYPHQFLVIRATISTWKNSKNYWFFSCRIDPYLQGKLSFIWCWLVRWTRWRNLIFGQSWHLLEKIIYEVSFWTQCSQFLENKKNSCYLNCLLQHWYH
jgi:hypothetical protein